MSTTGDSMTIDQIPDVFENIFQPKFQVLELTMRVPVESFVSKTGDKEFGGEVTTGTKFRHNSIMGWGFEVHVKDADLIMEVKPEKDSPEIKCSLFPWCSQQLLKENVTYMDTGGYGVVIVSVPKFCHKDEAKALVHSAFSTLIQTGFEKNHQVTASVQDFQSVINAAKKAKEGS